MDRILSARVDESTVHWIRSLAHRLRTSQKKVIEEAIHLYAQKIDSEAAVDVFAQTCGAWQREETADQITDGARTAFRLSMEKHKQ